MDQIRLQPLNLQMVSPASEPTAPLSLARRPMQNLPEWTPDVVRIYLEHTEEGVSYRILAERHGSHPSTVMRQIRRFEARRDDPILDEALDALVVGKGKESSKSLEGEEKIMSVQLRESSIVSDTKTVLQEARRILRRLAEPGAVLAIAPDMENAVVLRDFPDGRSARTGVVERAVVHAFVLKEWIVCRKAGRISRYEISPTGRTFLKQLIDQPERDIGFAEASSSFGIDRLDWSPDVEIGEEGLKKSRYNLAESPIAILGRRRDKDGKLFLEPELVEAAEQLREDFELAQMAKLSTGEWSTVLTYEDRSNGQSATTIGKGNRAARERVNLALRDLGPGLADVVLRVCCHLEGIETAERRMGWAARSGKIVLRIALQRLRRHYDGAYGRSGPLIG